MRGPVCFAAGLLMLCLVMSAHAAAKEYAHFRIAVPDDWSEVSHGEDRCEFMAPDGSAKVGVASLAVGDKGFAELARHVAQAADAELLEDEDGDYTFEFTEGGKEGNAMLTREGGRLLVITVLGMHPHLEGIMDSIEARQ